MNNDSKKRVAVLMGGVSNEREVSLVSGANVSKALKSTGKYDVVDVVLDSEDISAVPQGIDAAYIALHGGWGEDGGVQEALDRLGIPYTGPGAECSRRAMDKIATKRALDAAGVPTAEWIALGRDDVMMVSPFGYPVVVKAPRDGSSVGVYKCMDDAQFAKAVEDARRIDAAAGNAGEAIVERYVDGRETTVGVIDGEALPAIEIVAKGGWYGYDEKYNSDETRYPFLSDSGNASDAALEETLKKVALAAYDALGCRGVARADFRVDGEGRPFVLELNTSPGFTSHSLVPKAGMKTGLTFAEVCERILSAATFDRR